MAIKETLYFVLLIVLPVAMMAKQVPIMPEAWDDIDYVEASTPDDYEPTDQTIGKCDGREMKKQIESIKSLLDDLSTKFESCQGSQGALCPSGWTRFNGHCYLASSTSRTWDQAKAHCEKLGGELVKITSAEENQFVLAFARKLAPTVGEFWIGLKWNSKEYDFVWSDQSLPTYRNWGRGEPTGHGREPCSIMWINGNQAGKWNDRGCGTSKTYPAGSVCKKIVLSATANPDTAYSDCPAGWLRYGGQCYYIDDTPTLKQADARKTCQNMGADLPVIRSAAENKFIFNLMKKQRTLTFLGVWLGMHRSTADSKFYWVDGTPLEGHQYQNWAYNEPNNVGNTEHCGHMYGTSGLYNVIPGKWNDVSCVYRPARGRMEGPVILCQKPISDSEGAYLRNSHKTPYAWRVKSL